MMVATAVAYGSRTISDLNWKSVFAIVWYLPGSSLCDGVYLPTFRLLNATEAANPQSKRFQLNPELRGGQGGRS